MAARTSTSIPTKFPASSVYSNGLNTVSVAIVHFLPEGTECLLVLGGDGTLLQALDYFADKQKIEAASTSGLVLILAGAGTAMAWGIANERVMDQLIGPLSSIPSWLFLLLVNILMLICGMFMDDYASTVILAPIIAPIAWALGINPLHIGVVFCVNLVVGLATPPFGITLFVTSPVAGVRLEETAKEALPFLLVTIGVLLLVTFVPQFALWLPNLMGYTG